MAFEPVILLRRPRSAQIQRFLEDARRAPFSYGERGGSRSSGPPGYDHDHNRVRLGEGPAAFERARRALERWTMFPAGWSTVTPCPAPLEEGVTVAVAFHLLGAWWLNACRIVYVLDEREPVRRRGFAYGTLSCHVERGEECFAVEELADGSVWYDLRAFSRPRFWAARLARPVARSLQRRFVRDSQAAMQAAVARA